MTRKSRQYIQRHVMCYKNGGGAGGAGGGKGSGGGEPVVTSRNALGGADVVENDEFRFVAGNDGLNDKATGRRIEASGNELRMYYTDRFGSEVINDAGKLERYKDFIAKSRALASERKPTQQAPERRESPAERALRKQKEREYDRKYNEGGEGYNPYRD